MESKDSEPPMAAAPRFLVKTLVGAEDYCAAETRERLSGLSFDSDPKWTVQTKPFGCDGYLGVYLSNNDNEAVEAARTELLELATAHHVMSYRYHFRLGDGSSSDADAKTETSRGEETMISPREALYEHAREKLSTNILSFGNAMVGTTFRVTCGRIDGPFQGLISKHELEYEIGGAIAEVYGDRYGWKPKMKGYDLHIRAELIGSVVVIGIQLNTSCLFRGRRSFARYKKAAALTSNDNDNDPELLGGERTTQRSWIDCLGASLANSEKLRGSNYAQLSTVTENGEPRCRTVVVRGFLDETLIDPLWLGGSKDQLKPCVLKLCTDRRSNKVGEIAHQPISELVWWFPKSSEQYRIRGVVLLVGDEDDDHDNDNSNNINNTHQSLQHARTELWNSLSDAARDSFLDDDEDGGRDNDGSVVPPNFLLMLLNPLHVDYLRLAGTPYRRIDWRNDTSPSSAWSSHRAKP